MSAEKDISLVSSDGDDSNEEPLSAEEDGVLLRRECLGIRKSHQSAGLLRDPGQAGDDKQRWLWANDT